MDSVQSNDRTPNVKHDSELLDRATRVEIYDGSPVATWLEKLAPNYATETVPA